MKKIRVLVTVPCSGRKLPAGFCCGAQIGLRKRQQYMSVRSKDLAAVEMLLGKAQVRLQDWLGELPPLIIKVADFWLAAPSSPAAG